MKQMVNIACKKETEEGKSGCCCCSGPVCASGESEKYPYNMRLSLEDDQLEALAVRSLPAVGSTMMMHCIVRVTGCREDEKGNGEMERCVSLQITDLSLEAAAQPKKAFNMAETAAALYSKKE